MAFPDSLGLRADKKKLFSMLSQKKKGRVAPGKVVTVPARAFRRKEKGPTSPMDGTRSNRLEGKRKKRPCSAITRSQ